MQVITMNKAMANFEDLYNAKVTMLLIGLPGLGKTEMIVKKSKELLADDGTEASNSYEENDGILYTKDIPGFFSIDMSAIPADGLMMPYLDNQGEDRLKRDMLNEFKQLKKYLETYPENDAIFFIDEMTSANQDDQRTLMNFVQSGLLPDGSRIDISRVEFVLAGNPSADMPGYEDYDGATNPIEEAVITRGATFYVTADVREFIGYGSKYNDEKGRNNIHPYIIAALKNDGSIFGKRVEDDNRLLNARTASKLSDYFYTTNQWRPEVVNALVGDSTGATLCSLIEKLDKSVDYHALFGAKSSTSTDKMKAEINKAKDLDKTEFDKYQHLQPFEQYYIVQMIVQSPAIQFSHKNNMIKLKKLLQSTAGDVTTSFATYLTSAENSTLKNAKDIMNAKWLTDSETDVTSYLREAKRLNSSIA